jgi:hypothetical protein
MTYYQFLTGPLEGCVIDNRDSDWKENHTLTSFFSSTPEYQKAFVSWLRDNSLDDRLLSEDDLDFYWRSWISSWMSMEYIDVVD